MSEPVIWQPARASAPSLARPALGIALKRGILGTCPNCGKSNLFRGFLRPVAICAHCGTELGRVRADDIPPYITIMLVGHIVVPLMLWLERAQTPPLWVHTAIFIPVTLALTLALIRPVKGGVVGLMLHLGMVKAEGDA